MKNYYQLFRTGATFVLISMLTTSLFAQDAIVGTVKNGVAVVSDKATANSVLMGALPATSVVSNINIQLEPGTGKYFLLGDISNSTISGKAIELHNDNGILRAVAGPGIEITCTGYKCERCVPRITKFRVTCICEDQGPPPDSRCDMTSKVKITAW